MHARDGIKIIDNVINEHEYCFYNDTDENTIRILPSFDIIIYTRCYRITLCALFKFPILHNKSEISSLLSTNITPFVKKTHNLKSVMDNSSFFLSFFYSIF